MKLTFPLYLVTDARKNAVFADICLRVETVAHLGSLIDFIGPSLASNTVLYTDETEASADATARLAARAPEWVPLSSLKPGARFEAGGWQGVKTNVDMGNGACQCLNSRTGSLVRETGATLVKEIP